jgi:hypothetical protein
MAEDTRDLTPPDDGETLDLRELARPTRPVLTSVGRLVMRRQSALGPLDRVRVARLRAEAEQKAAALDLMPDDSGPGTLEELAETVVEAEAELLRLVVPGITEEQLAELSAPERAGVLALFFGATPAGALQAVAGVREMLDGREPRGARRSRASSGSTAATRRAG